MGIRFNRSVVRNRAGAVTVEFAILLFPLLLLACMTLEEALLLFYQQNLSVAVYQEARYIRTGQQATADSGLSGSALTNNVITHLCSYTVITPCDTSTNQFEMKVQSWTPPASPPNALSPDGTAAGLVNAGDSVYPSSADTPCNGVMIQVWYWWPIQFAPLNTPFLLNNTLPTTNPGYLMTFASASENEQASGQQECSSL